MSLLLSIVSLLLIAASLACMARGARTFNPYITILLFLLFVLQGEDILEFSYFYPSLLIALWGLYIYMKESFFWALFLVSAASLLYPPFIWLSPLLMVALFFFESGDKGRKLLKSIWGLLLPYLYLLVYRFVVKGEIKEYFTAKLGVMTDVGMPSLSYSLPEYALMLCIVVILFHTLGTVFNNYIERTDRVPLRISGILFLYALPVFLLFSSDGTNEATLLSGSGFSLLFSFHFNNVRRGMAVKELALLLILFLLCGVTCAPDRP